ncbi:uncharacterized protein PHALS_12458 [Plasmopara halstedii]|uniref:Uncharacterized protein n=1 Tax=Plasmopara halstedii TaxID=4781 RepID=A0A0P1AL88_PLAHL|nr:uncharacterized protein PHALS_12458 [Plasmopara halstedii]CEG42161.1 hypothetical protein PHALS_12458 [Plasmopara halstedii]|eukprot:XP_024578530.1 hypothetical protein PHALS_12458 [Plasmopara halstedii]
MRRVDQVGPPEWHRPIGFVENTNVLRDESHREDDRSGRHINTWAVGTNIDCKPVRDFTMS